MGEKKSQPLFYLFFWPRCVAYGSLVPQSGVEPGPSAVRAWSVNHWTDREFKSQPLKDKVWLEI